MLSMLELYNVIGQYVNIDQLKLCNAPRRILKPRGVAHFLPQTSEDIHIILPLDNYTLVTVRGEPAFWAFSPHYLVKLFHCTI